MSVQYYKGDDLEKKFYASGYPILNNLSGQKTEFFNDAYACFVLGELLFDLNASPLSKAISRDIFRESFSTIFDAFLVAGSFESYLTVFRNIFGESVSVEFTIPAPGKLNIDIEAAGSALYNFVARQIVDNLYVTDTIVDDEGDTIVFQSIKGFESQYELERMLFEMVPDGIYTEITLTVGA